MHWALVAGKKVKATSSGEIGKCRLCGKKVRAHCGKIVVWHWKHVSKAHCDPWYEPETEWHRDWKAHFPDAWQECIVEDAATDKKHIADVRTQAGLVIEFQNSPISISVLKQREHFYNDMVWVVNAQKFSKNIRMEKVSRDVLRNQITSQYFENRKGLLTSIKGYPFKLEKAVKELEKKIKDCRRKLEYQKDILKEQEQYKLKIHKTVELICL